MVSEPVMPAFDAAKRLQELGCEVDFGAVIYKREDKLDTERMKQVVKEYDGFIGMSREKFPREVLQEATRLGVIGKYGIGVDHIDVAAANEAGVLISNSPVNRMPVAEHAVTLMLALLKGLKKSRRDLNVPNWRSMEMEISELGGKTVGFVGLGGIAREIIARLSGWQCSFIGYDPYVSAEDAAKINVRAVDWNTLFQSADVISLHLPITAQTKGIVGEKEFAMMKDTALFINTARGKLVDQAAMIAALKAGQIAGLGLDVMEKEEPVPVDDPIMEIADYDNVILTPHSAGWTKECQKRLADTTTDSVIVALQGQTPPFLVNPDALPAWKKKLHLSE